jgi:DNA polymerase elongation subunit (family B)
LAASISALGQRMLTEAPREALRIGFEMLNLDEDRFIYRN